MDAVVVVFLAVNGACFADFGDHVMAVVRDEEMPFQGIGVAKRLQLSCQLGDAFAGFSGAEDGVRK